MVYSPFLVGNDFLVYSMSETSSTFVANDPLDFSHPKIRPFPFRTLLRILPPSPRHPSDFYVSVPLLSRMSILYHP